MLKEQFIMQYLNSLYDLMIDDRIREIRVNNL